MGIGNSKACRGGTADLGFITRYRYFRNGIGNLFPFTVFVQAGEGSLPVVVAAEGQGLIGFLPIRQQLHSHTLRPQPVLVVVVRPCLCHRNAGLLRRVSIGHIVAIHHGGITRNRIFGDGIEDFLTVCILRQAGKTPLPAILCGYGLRLLCQFLPVGIDPDGDRLRPLAVLIVVVIPRFGAGNRNGLRRMAVGDGEAPGRRVSDIGRITAYRRFFYGIIDLFTILKFIQIFKGTLPAIRFAQSQRLAC